MSYLRDYQQEAKTGVLRALEEADSTLVVLPTGTGKTELGLSIMDEWPGDGQALWLAHREELIWQPWERWKSLTGQYAEIEMGQYRKGDGRTCFASKDSLWREKRLQAAYPDPKAVDIIFVDEAHHCVKKNKTYSRILEYIQDGNPGVKVVGLTATPDRTDEQALGQMFDSVAYDYPLYDPTAPSAISDGWLVPFEQQYVEVEDVSFDDIGIRGGDFIDSQLAEQMLHEKAMLGQASAALELAGDGTTLAFAASIAQAIKQAEILNRHKPEAAKAIASRIEDEYRHDFVVDSSDKDKRKSVLRDWGEGLFQYFCNVGVFTEGMDEPTIRTILMGRPTKSRSLYAQMAGRGTRALRGVIEGDGANGTWRIEDPEDRVKAIAESAKPRIQIVDFVGNSRHSLISAYDILGGRLPDEAVERAKENKNGESKDAVDELDAAMKELQEEAAERRKNELEQRKRVTAKAKFKSKLVDPFQTIGVIPSREPGWHKGRRPTDKQKAALRKFKLDDYEVNKMSFWQASKMLDGLIGRCKTDMATYKQCKVLAKFGEDGTDMSFRVASSVIDKIAKNGWKPLVA